MADPGQLRSIFTVGGETMTLGAAPPPGHCTDTAIDDELLS